MKRFIYFIVFLLIIPVFVGGFAVFAYSALGFERDYSQLYDKAASYGVGMIVGWWTWGAR